MTRALPGSEHADITFSTDRDHRNPVADPSWWINEEPVEQAQPQTVFVPIPLGDPRPARGGVDAPIAVTMPADGLAFAVVAVPQEELGA